MARLKARRVLTTTRVEFVPIDDNIVVATSEQSTDPWLDTLVNTFKIDRSCISLHPILSHPMYMTASTSLVQNWAELGSPTQHTPYEIACLIKYCCELGCLTYKDFAANIIAYIDVVQSPKHDVMLVALEKYFLDHLWKTSWAHVAGSVFTSDATSVEWFADYEAYCRDHNTSPLVSVTGLGSNWYLTDAEIDKMYGEKDCAAVYKRFNLETKKQREIYAEHRRHSIEVNAARDAASKALLQQKQERLDAEEKLRKETRKQLASEMAYNPRKNREIIARNTLALARHTIDKVRGNPYLYLGVALLRYYSMHELDADIPEHDDDDDIELMSLTKLT